jgi:hypothetical protein
MPCASEKTIVFAHGSADDFVRLGENARGDSKAKFLDGCALAVSGAGSRLRVSVTMTPTTLHRMGSSLSQPHANLLAT